MITNFKFSSVLMMIFFFGIHLTSSYAGSLCHSGCNHSHFAEYELKLEVDNERIEFQIASDTKFVMPIDNTRVTGAPGLFSFFAAALTKVAIWGGIKLTNWVRSKISRRSKEYEGYFRQGDTGVRKAYDHWHDMMNRSCGNQEPDHMPRMAGFQGSSECPICSRQVSDLRTR